MKKNCSLNEVAWNPKGIKTFLLLWEYYITFENNRTAVAIII